jgi:hypothetical protein
MAARQSRYDLFRHPVRKIILLGVPTHVRKGEDCDRRLVRERQLGWYELRSGLRQVLFPYRSNEANTLSWGCADQALLFTAVPNGGPGGADLCAQRGFGHYAPAPNGRDQIVPAHHALALLDQVNQEIENLRLDRHESAAPAELLPRLIENEIFEQIQQLAVLPQTRRQIPPCQSTICRTKNQESLKGCLTFFRCAAARSLEL